ncbi:hypothetical protein [Rubritalea sp.]|uniref:hypothetical protein n=1 Tax=Rubritalea sp. TaxID=2109375 RepID=UPI003EFB1D60
MNTIPKGYFCDLCLDDVDALANASYLLLCNGTTSRSYGSQKRECHYESEFDVLVVNLESLHDPLAERSSIDHLVFLNEDTYEQLWLGCGDVDAEPLSQVCVQRALSQRPVNDPPELFMPEADTSEYIVSPYDARELSSFSEYYKSLLVRSFAQKESSFFELLRHHGMCVTY